MQNPVLRGFIVSSVSFWLLTAAILLSNASPSLLLVRIIVEQHATASWRHKGNFEKEVILGSALCWCKKGLKCS
jgi:hypothetical protein